MDGTYVRHRVVRTRASTAYRYVFDVEHPQAFELDSRIARFACRKVQSVKTTMPRGEIKGIYHAIAQYLLSPFLLNSTLIRQLSTSLNTAGWPLAWVPLSTVEQVSISHYTSDNPTYKSTRIQAVP